MLKVKNIGFAYQEKKVIDNISFSINQGKNVAIIGESGCGKSTLLKLIYGLYDLDQGEITYDHKQILGPKFKLIAGEDFIKYLAQDFDLMPFVTVGENVGKFLSNVHKEKKQDRISELLDIVEMSEYVNVKAKFLSGGQMQRVAIARVLALEPKILLLDEPFSHIDNFRKNKLRRNLFAYLKSQNITCLVATHDSTDVLSFADEVIVLRTGKIIQNGIPSIIFENPKDYYTASLFGDANIINESYFENKPQIDTNIILFSHQLIVSDFSRLKVKIISNYFRGSYYLIEGKYEMGTVFFENKFSLAVGSDIFLKKTPK